VSIVFNFSGPVTIHVSGAATIALPADAPAFVAGPAVGGEGSGIGHAATSHSEGDSRKDKLTELLNDPKYRFRKIGTLADAIGEDEDTTVELLESIGARQERDNEELWGLTSRVGQPKGDSYSY